MIDSNSSGLDQVNISFLPSSDRAETATPLLPLVISPRWNASVEFLVAWTKANRAWLDDMLLRYGAILVRGFAIETATDMEKSIQAYQPDLNKTYRGTSPRRPIPGTQYIFSAGRVRARALAPFLSYANHICICMSMFLFYVSLLMVCNIICLMLTFRRLFSFFLLVQSRSSCSLSDRAAY
jgi:Taurine catabolism dioxygenase TauD, TfdA family